MIGPTILELGTEEQRQRHIPRIITGEAQWCQGYSEPGAGSDLAGLQTKAVLEGDEFIINGQKILDQWCAVRQLDVRPSTHGSRSTETRRHQLCTAANGSTRCHREADQVDLWLLTIL